MQKKLVYILNQYSNKEGSHFYHVLRLLEEIAKHGVEVALVIEKAKDIPVFDIPNIQVIAQKQNGIKRFFELFSILKELNKQGYKKTFIRISQNGAIPAILVSKLYGGEVYYWQSGQGHILDKQKPLNFEKIKWYLKSKIPFEFVKKYTDYFVTGPESMLDYYEEVVGVRREKLRCLYNDIDLNRFKILNENEKDKIKNELNIPKDKKIILFVHRLSPVRKSLYYMPFVVEKVLKENKDYICYVIGGGSELEQLRKLVKEKHLENQIFILGERPNKEIHKFYQISDVFINPTFTEGFPRVLIEAMASGLPIVTTNAGGIKDILAKKQKEFMVDKNDREAFAKKLEELIKNENIQKELSKENLERVKRYSTENVAKMYVNVIFGEKNG